MTRGTDRRNSAVAPPTIGDLTIYLAQDPVDFRLGINGLSTMIEATLKFDPFTPRADAPPRAPSSQALLSGPRCVRLPSARAQSMRQRKDIAG